jgi:hypothetical protein
MPLGVGSIAVALIAKWRNFQRYSVASDRHIRAACPRGDHRLGLGVHMQISGIRTD